jgi:putative acetyltransferase
MRTPSTRRKTGAGRALLNHIIDVARARGYQVLYLETGRHGAFGPAQTLYGSAGFKPCGPFGTAVRQVSIADITFIWARLT